MTDGITFFIKKGQEQNAPGLFFIALMSKKQKTPYLLSNGEKGRGLTKKTL